VLWSAMLIITTNQRPVRRGYGFVDASAGARPERVEEAVGGVLRPLLPPVRVVALIGGIGDDDDFGPGRLRPMLQEE